MSERGSFCTEYVYCHKCFEVLKDVLLGDRKYLKGVVIPAWGGCNDKELPIIAGKVGGMYSGEEIDFFEVEVADEASSRLCHPVRVAVLAECGDSRIVVLGPEPPTASAPPPA